MSLLSRKNAAQPKTTVTASDVFFNFSPQAHPGTMPTAQKLKLQTEVIQKMKSSNLDIFKSNHAAHHRVLHIKGERRGDSIHIDFIGI